MQLTVQSKSCTDVSTDENDSGSGTRMSTPIGEVLLSEYSVHELPSECSEESALDTYPREKERDSLTGTQVHKTNMHSSDAKTNISDHISL